MAGFCIPSVTHVTIFFKYDRVLSMHRDAVVEDSEYARFLHMQRYTRF